MRSLLACFPLGAGQGMGPLIDPAGLTGAMPLSLLWRERAERLGLLPLPLEPGVNVCLAVPGVPARVQDRWAGPFRSPPLDGPQGEVEVPGHLLLAQQPLFLLWHALNIEQSRLLVLTGLDADCR